MIDDTLDRMWNILEENDFQIDVAVESEIKCTSCKNILIKPRNVPCGCRYCHDCLISYLNEEEKFCLGDSEYCKKVLINIDKNVFIDQVANTKISRIVVKCPLESCELKTKLGKMADHMITCDRQPVTKMKQHLKHENKCTNEQMESNQKTILALEENVSKLLKENRTSKELETEKSHQNNKNEEIILAMQTKAEEQKQGIKTNTENIEDLKQRCDKKYNKIEKNQEQIKIKNDEMSQKNADVATQSKQMETKLTQPQANQNCGEFLWCIENLKDKWERGMRLIEPTIYSDPFYSHKNGYKICLLLWVDFWSWSASSLRFYVCIMRGEFDNILQWPFRHGVKLDLLNQKTGLAHISVNFCSDPNHEAFQKPTSERNDPYDGNYLYIHESQLNADLCQGDKILIKATLLMNP